MHLEFVDKAHFLINLNIEILKISEFESLYWNSLKSSLKICQISAN